MTDTKSNRLTHVLWGVAVLGILTLNIRDFGQTRTALNQFIVNPHGGNYWLLTITHTLFGNPFYALFILLFGAGIALFFASPRPGSVDEFIRRQFWLMAFGLLNAIVLLWQNDLLFPFSVVGILLFTIHRLSARVLLIGAVVTALLFSGKGYWSFSETTEKYTKYKTVMAVVAKNKKLDGAASRKKKQPKLTDEQKADTTAWKSIVNSTKFDKKANDEAIKSMRSGYADVWSHVVSKAQYMEARWLYQLGLWELASLMLLGMALYKWGFFTNSFPLSQYAIIGIVGLLTGQVLAWFSLGDYEGRLSDMTRYVTTTQLPLYDMLLPFARACSAVGWAALITALYGLGRMGWFWGAIGAVGEMALTNYLLQTALCTLFFYGYGMSYFGELKLWQLYFLVVEIWLIQTVFSVVWLRTFRTGPAEWLWQSLIHWERQPLKRPELTNTQPIIQPSFTA